MLKNKLKTIKTFTIGLIVGLSLTTIPIFAEDIKNYIVKDNPFPILIDGVKTEVKGLNINDKTWIQLSSLGSVGLSVKFNQVTEVVELQKESNYTDLKFMDMRAIKSNKDNDVFVSASDVLKYQEKIVDMVVEKINAKLIVIPTVTPTPSPSPTVAPTPIVVPVGDVIPVNRVEENTTATLTYIKPNVRLREPIYEGYNKDVEGKTIDGLNIYSGGVSLTEIMAKYPNSKIAYNSKSKYSLNIDGIDMTNIYVNDIPRNIYSREESYIVSDHYNRILPYLK